MKRIRFVFSLLLMVGTGLSCKQEPVELDLPLRERLVREWKLSTEEAQPGREVYRSTGFQFPNQAYRPTYRFSADQRVLISYQTANGTERFFQGTWALSENDELLTITGLNPVGLRLVTLRWRIVNVRTDLLLVEPQS